MERRTEREIRKVREKRAGMWGRVGIRTQDPTRYPAVTRQLPFTLPGRLPIVVPEKPPPRSHTEAGKFVLTAWSGHNYLGWFSLNLLSFSFPSSFHNVYIKL